MRNKNNRLRGWITMNQIKYWAFAFVVLLTIPQIAVAKKESNPDGQISSIKEKVKDLVHMDGFLDLYWDQQKGHLLLQIDSMGDEFIYQSSMPRGVGSNDLGLDRGQLGATRLVEFYRSGPKVLLIENNTDYRANSMTRQKDRQLKVHLPARWSGVLKSLLKPVTQCLSMPRSFFCAMLMTYPRG